MEDPKAVIIKEFEYLMNENKRLNEENIQLKQEVNRLKNTINYHCYDAIGRPFFE